MTTDTEQRAIDRDEYGGPVDSEVSYFRDSESLVGYAVVEGVTCQCGSCEVWQPMQTMDMPMVLRCLRCGRVDPSGDFEHTLHTNTEQ